MYYTMHKKNIKQQLPGNMFYNPLYNPLYKCFIFFYKIKDYIYNLI